MYPASVMPNSSTELQIYTCSTLIKHYNLLYMSGKEYSDTIPLHRLNMCMLLMVAPRLAPNSLIEQVKAI